MKSADGISSTFSRCSGQFESRLPKLRYIIQVTIQHSQYKFWREILSVLRRERRRGPTREDGEDLEGRQNWKFMSICFFYLKRILQTCLAFICLLS